jgi:hypothetical protein
MQDSHRGAVKDEAGRDESTKKVRVPTVPKNRRDQSSTPEATRDPRLNDAEKTPGSGMTPDDSGEAPTG